MGRPPLEVADLVRAAGDCFHRTKPQVDQREASQSAAGYRRCRTAALGGHLDQCTRCGHRAISYNSCRNRHCPKCQASARDRWLEKRRRELLPTHYVHVVFTLPRELAPLAVQNKKVVYDLLFRSSAETLLEVARDPAHLGAEIGFFSVLHTWNQKLGLHPHVHCVVPAGGLSADHTRWIKTRYAFFLPVKVLSRVFRGKFVADSQARLPRRPAGIPRRSDAPRSAKNFLLVAQKTVPKRLGGLLETSLRGARACAPLSGPLHSSRSHLQPPARSRSPMKRSPFAGVTRLTTMNRSC